MNKKMVIVIFILCVVSIFFIINVAITEKQRQEERLNAFHTNNVAQAFEKEGFTKESAEKLAEIFEKVGITYISDIKKGPGTGINELQAYTCRIYNSKTETLVFTFENGYLEHIELNGSLFEQGELHVVLYENGRYKYKVDNENNRIVEIE